MAAAEAVTNKDDSKVKEDDMAPIIPTGWSPAEGLSIDLLIQAMKGVEDKFREMAKELFGYDFPDYEATKSGLVMLLMGGQHFIGLVKLSKPNMLGGYYASIRVSRVVGTISKMPFSLRGFYIDSKPFLHYVESGSFGDNFFNGWKHVEGKESIEAMKAALSAKDVKNVFIKKAKEICGMSFDEYDITDTGYVLTLLGGRYYNGLVKLSKPGTIGGFYASIRCFQRQATSPPPNDHEWPWVLQGFLIDGRPFIHFVRSGQYGIFAREHTMKHVNVKNIVKDDKDELLLGKNNTGTAIGFIGIGVITHADTGFVQTLVNKVKDEIKEQAGITTELSSFNVTTAAVQNMGTLRAATFYAKIYTGINPRTQFQQYINVSLTNSVFGDHQFVTVNSANAFPL